MEIFTSQVHEEIDSRTVYVELLLNNFKSSFTKLLDFRSKITSKVWSGNRTKLATNSVGNFKPEIKYLGGYFSEYYSPFGQFACIFFFHPFEHMGIGEATCVLYKDAVTSYFLGLSMMSIETLESNCHSDYDRLNNVIYYPGRQAPFHFAKKVESST